MSEETIVDIVAEMRECIEAADPSVWNDARIAGLVNTTKAQQLAYLDRIEAAAKRERENDTKLLFRLLWFDVDEYCSDWAVPAYRQTVEDCCRRVGIPYCDSGREIARAMEEHPLAGKGEFA